MSDQGFREIQLSGKQLVFLFMASVVVAVTVFLLGVSVGRGVRQSTAPELQASTDMRSDPIDPASIAVTVPPPTEMTPDDTRYSQLDRSGRSNSGGPGTTPASTTEATPVDEPMPDRAASDTKTAAAGAKPVATPPAPPPAASKASDNNDLPRTAANGQWVVQISAYRSRESADREVALLKKKGYAAFLLSGGTNFYRVR